MSGQNLVAGIHAVESLLKNDPAQISRLLCVDTRKDKRLQKLQQLAKNQGIAVEYTERTELDKLCGHRKHQSVLAWYQGTPEKNESQLFTDLASQQQPWLILVLDEIQDPHNLGACLRSADGFAVDAVVIPSDNAVGITPVVQKVAAGAAASVPLYRVSNLARALRRLQDEQVWIYGAAGEAEASLYDTQFSGSVALVLGAEGSGLRKLTREACDQLYKIPLQGQVSSLNVSVATGISLSEIQRQRSCIENRPESR